jgi:hypothetical protein
MQSLMVLLLELSVDGVHLTMDKEVVKTRAEQLVAWLQCMAVVDNVSERAHTIVSQILDKQDPDQAMRKHMPHPRMDQAHQEKESHTFEEQQQFYENNDLATFEPTNMSWPSADAFNSSSFFSLDNTGAFYPSDRFGAQYFNEPDGDPSEVPTSMAGGDMFPVDFAAWQWDPALVGMQGEIQGQDQNQDQGGEGHFPGSFDDLEDFQLQTQNQVQEQNSAIFDDLGEFPLQTQNQGQGGGQGGRAWSQ